MGLRIIVGYEGGNTDSSVQHAVFYCSVSDVAFGPVIYSDSGEALEIAEWFLDYVWGATGDRDMRSLPLDRIDELYSQFQRLHRDKVPCACGHEIEAHFWCGSRRACSADECDCRGGWQPKMPAPIPHHYVGGWCQECVPSHNP